MTRIDLALLLSELQEAERDSHCFSDIAQCIRPLRIQNDPYGDRFGREHDEH